MKQRGLWKMRLSVLLMVVMLLNMTFTAFAEWREESDGWHYYNEAGDEIRSKEKKIRGKWYSFDERGVMRTGWLDHLGEGKSFYAVPLGNIAEEQWVKVEEDDAWYYFDKISETEDGLEGGVVPPNTWREIHGKYYYFNSESKMLSSQFCDVGEIYCYAHPDGSLANNEWLLLGETDENGKRGHKECDHFDSANCDCSWYYFKELEVENNELKGGAITAARDEIREKSVRNVTYAFDENGKMLSREWNNQTHHYFLCTGEKATGRWLPINGFWYQFDANGDVTKYAQISDQEGTLASGMDGVASSSNAPYPTVAWIDPVEKNVKVEIGKEVNVQFKVNLASNSNASNAKLTKDHDIWLKCSEGGKITDKKIEDDNIYTVVYSAGNKAGSEQIYLWVDGARSSEPVTVTTTLTQTSEDEEIKVSEVKDVVDNIFNNSQEDVQGAVSSLKQLYAPEQEDSVRQEVQNRLLSEGMKSGDNTLKKLEERYTIERKIKVEEPLVSEEVEEEYGDMGVTVTGAGFNAPDGSSVQLQVALPEEDWELEGTYQNTVAFDLKLLIDQSEKKELDVPIVISIKKPDGFTNEDKLINLHEGEEVNVKFRVSGGKVYFVADRFSTYVFAITHKPSTEGTILSSGGSGGRSRRDVNSELNTGLGSNSRTGNWIKDSKGWWIHLNDGTYPINTWKYLDFNGVYQWYHFDSMGYMRTGWYTDTDGHRYYLNPVSDGTQGAMAIGWKYIDGYWYYFNAVSDGTRGALLVNTTTPDGYTVNANGQWIP